MARVSRGMTEHEWKMFNYAIKKEKVFNDYRYHCSCGHSLIIGPSIPSKLCTYCGRLVFKDEELQKIYDREMENREKKMNFKKEMRKHL